MKKSLLIVVLLFLFGVLNFVIINADTEKDFTTEELRFFKRRCTLCHDLDRIYKKGKLKPWEWSTVISWMQNRLPDIITDEDAVKIVNYLSTDKYLFEYRCTHCHSVERIYEKQFDFKKWERVVLEMKEKNPEWIHEEEVSRIAYFISDTAKTERKKLEHGMLKNLLFLEKNIGEGDLPKLLHSAEALDVCADGMCNLPPLEKSDDFGKFVQKLNDLTENLKNNIKTQEPSESKKDIQRIRNACQECHGSLNK